MNIDAIAAQLRTAAPVFAGNVAGAAGYANGVQDQTWLPLPAAYVIPRDEDAEANEAANGLWQVVHERVGVIVVLSTPNAGGQVNLTDRRAQTAAAQLPALRAAVFSALLNWRPDWDPNNPTVNREARGMYYIGGRFPEEGAFDRARFFYEFVLGLDTVITDADGWQPTTTPLTDIRSTVDSTTTFDTPLPQ